MVENEMRNERNKSNFRWMNICFIFYSIVSSSECSNLTGCEFGKSAHWQIIEFQFQCIGGSG